MVSAGRLAKFETIYRESLAAAMTANPDDFVVKDPKVVADKVIAAIREKGFGAVNIHGSHAFRDAARRLGLKANTYVEWARWSDAPEEVVNTMAQGVKPKPPRIQIYCGLLPEKRNPVVFGFLRRPTEEDRLPYAAVTGPFATLQGALFFAEHSPSNPHCTGVAQAERLAKKNGHQA